MRTTARIFVLPSCFDYCDFFFDAGAFGRPKTWRDAIYVNVNGMLSSDGREVKRMANGGEWP
jgi:hypothetical protein